MTLSKRLASTLLAAGSLWLAATGAALSAAGTTDATASLQATPETVPPADAPRARPIYGLLLPLESPAFGRAADAVRQGFLAAAKVENEADAVAIATYSDAGSLQAAYAALGKETALIVGPLTRDDTRVVAGSRRVVPTLMLNLPEDGALPPDLYALSLSIEAEARQVARLAATEGCAIASTVAAKGPLATRIVTAFQQEFAQRGGSLLGTFTPSADPEILKLMKTELNKLASNCVLVAGDGGFATTVKPYLGQRAAYAVSQVQDGGANWHDLGGLKWIDLPWLVHADHPAVMAYPRADWRGNSALERLYALGVDAYRVARQLHQGTAATAVRLDGVTGNITGAVGGVFLREGTVAVIKNGRPTAADSEQALGQLQ